MSSLPRARVRSAAAGTAGTSAARRKPRGRWAAGAASYRSHSCWSRTPSGSVRSGGLPGASRWRSVVSEASQTTTRSTCGPARPDQPTFAWDTPCASGVLPSGTPGGSGGGVGTAGTGLAATAVAGCAGTGTQTLGAAMPGAACLAQTWTPQRETAPKSRPGPGTVSR